MGIRERQERERETMRRAILDAARDLFVAEGYQHVSIRKIAERIEYSPAAIYGYFGGKDDIFVALAEEGFHLLERTASRVEWSDDPVESLRRGMQAFHEFSKRHPEHFMLMFLDRSVPRIGAHYPHFQRLITLKERMAEVVRGCVGCGAFPPSIDPMAAFRVVSTALLGAAGARLFNRLAPGEDADALAHDVIELTIAGLRSGVSLTFRPTGLPCVEVGSGLPPGASPAKEPGTSGDPSQHPVGPLSPPVGAFGEDPS